MSKGEKASGKPPWKPCTKQRTAGKKELQLKFHTQAYLSSMGKVMKWRLMEQQCLPSSVEGATAQRGGGTGNMEGGVKVRIPETEIT